MTELEKMQRAKLYLDKLANGINPLDDSAVPAQEVLNNVRLSRCFFYVSDLLRQIIENGGVIAKAAPKKAEKQPFALPFAKKLEFEFSDVPIPITHIARRINALIDRDTMLSLNYSGITNWLVSVGMLTVSAVSTGQSAKVPTPEGNKIGISSEERVGPSGSYLGVFYNETAQHFILDNLDAIVEFAQSSTALQGQPWTPAQDQCLLDLHRKAVPVSEIAVTLKRNASSVRSRLKKLESGGQL